MAGRLHALREQRRTGLTGGDGSRRRSRPPPGATRQSACRLLSPVVTPHRRRRDRRGRGLRGRLVPPTVSVGGRDVDVPLSQTRGERFDDLVLDAVEHLEERWSTQLEGVEFAVEDVPPVPVDGVLDEDVVADETAGGAVPLGRLLAAGSEDGAGPARIVVYRRPLEARAVDRLDLSDLVHDVVVDQVARLLGMDPDEIDPPSA